MILAMWLNRLTAVFLTPLARVYWRLPPWPPRDEFPMSGPLLVCPNHASYLDPWFVSACSPRRIHFLITDKWYNRSVIWRAFFDANGTLPVRVDEPQATIDDVCRYLSEGKAVGVFPEGGLSADGLIQRFRPGVPRIAAQSGAPVIPVGLRGNYEVLPGRSKFPRPRRVEVKLGEPMRFPDAPRTKRPTRRELADFNQLLLEQVSRLAGQPDAPERLSRRKKPAS